MIDKQNIYSKIFNEGLMLPYKKFPDRYFDGNTDEEFPKSEINKHSSWYRNEYNDNRNVIYWENSYGRWEKREYNNDGNLIYSEKNNGYWQKCEYDNNENQIYWENSNGDWEKREYNKDNNLIYWENNNRVVFDNRDQIQEGLMLPYKEKINFTKLSAQFEDFYNNSGFDTFLFETEDEPGIQYIEVILSIPFPHNEDIDKIEGTLYWGEDEPYIIQFYLNKINLNFEHKEQIFYDEININNVLTINRELYKYINYIEATIISRIS